MTLYIIFAIERTFFHSRLTFENGAVLQLAFLHRASESGAVHQLAYSFALPVGEQKAWHSRMHVVLYYSKGRLLSLFSIASTA